jgi:hypothetical protein
VPVPRRGISLLREFLECGTIFFDELIYLSNEFSIHALWSFLFAHRLDDSSVMIFVKLHINFGPHGKVKLAQIAGGN